MNRAFPKEKDFLISADSAVRAVRAGKSGDWDFECRGCGVEVRLCSYGETNKRAPYFSVTSGATKGHADDCTVDSRLRKRRSGKNDGVLGRQIIEGLVLDDSEERYSSIQPLGGSPTRAASTTNGGTPRVNPHTRGRKAGDLRVVVLEYAEDNHLASHSLFIPGVDATTYAGCFQPLAGKWNPGLKRYDATHLAGRYIYFGELRFTSRPSRNRDRYTLEFIQEASNGKKYTLEIDASGWATEEIQQVLDEIERARALTEQKYKERKAGKSPKALVFVLTELMVGDNRGYVSDPRLVCAMSTEEAKGIRYLRSENRGKVPLGHPEPVSHPLPVPSPVEQPPRCEPVEERHESLEGSEAGSSREKRQAESVASQKVGWLGRLGQRLSRNLRAFRNRFTRVW